MSTDTGRRTRGGDGVTHDFTYIKPRGRRLSEYEAVTCYTQPSCWGGGLERAGDLVLRTDGRPLFDLASTKTQAADWYAFRDPNQMWQRPYYTLQGDAEKGIEAATQTALAEGTLADMDPVWASDGLIRGYVPFARLEYALYRGMSYAMRESVSDTLNSVALFQAADKLRHAQAIILEGLDLEGVVPGFDASAAEAVWLDDPAWQPMRRLAEELMATEDWAEVMLVTNLVFEPLITEPLCRSLFSVAAARHGDILTPVVASTASADIRRNRRWAEEFVHFLAGDESYGDSNRELMAGWVSNWSPKVSAVLSPLASRFDDLLSQTTSMAIIATAAQETQGQLLARVGLHR
jgi:hypothetical protein